MAGNTQRKAQKQRDSNRTITQLNSHLLAISLAGVNGLAGLLDGGQNGIIVHGRFGDDASGLGVQLDVEGLDTCSSV